MQTVALNLKVTPAMLAALESFMEDEKDIQEPEDQSHHAWALVEVQSLLKDVKLFEKATVIGEVLGHTFYEHPRYGDEACLMIRDPEGVLLEHTGFWDLPSEDEMKDWIGNR